LVKIIIVVSLIYIIVIFQLLSILMSILFLSVFFSTNNHNIIQFICIQQYKFKLLGMIITRLYLYIKLYCIQFDSPSKLAPINFSKKNLLKL